MKEVWCEEFDKGKASYFMGRRVRLVLLEWRGDRDTFDITGWRMNRVVVSMDLFMLQHEGVVRVAVRLDIFTLKIKKRWVTVVVTSSMNLNFRMKGWSGRWLVRTRFNISSNWHKTNKLQLNRLNKQRQLNRSNYKVSHSFHTLSCNL